MGMLKTKQRPRIYYSDAQKALMWDRWQKGDSDLPQLHCGPTAVVGNLAGPKDSTAPGKQV